VYNSQFILFLLVTEPAAASTVSRRDEKISHKRRRYLEDEPVENVQHLRLFEYLRAELHAHDEFRKRDGTATQTVSTSAQRTVNVVAKNGSPYSITERRVPELQVT